MPNVPVLLVQFNRPGEVGGGILRLTKLVAVTSAPQVPRLSDLWVQVDGSGQVSHRVFRVAQLAMKLAPVQPREHVLRIQLDGLREVVEGLVQLTQLFPVNNAP